jgi:hypothetical protein
MEKDSRRAENTALRLPGKRQKDKHIDEDYCHPCCVFSGWYSESIPGIYKLSPVPQLPHGESKWIMRTRWM